MPSTVRSIIFLCLEKYNAFIQKISVLIIEKFDVLCFNIDDVEK